MRNAGYKKSSTSAIGLLIAGMILYGCGGNASKQWIIFTQFSAEEILTDSMSGDQWRYNEGSRIVAVDPGNSGKIAMVLTGDFYSARAPEISFDGKRMVFAGQKKKGDPWQIYEKVIGRSKSRKVVDKAENCTDPAYLPGERIVFSSTTGDESSNAGHVLYTCSLDGCCLKQITFHPHAEFAPSVLSDGRLVVISSQTYPVAGKPAYLSFRPDGTKAELYYSSEHTGGLMGKARETPDGRVLFVESETMSMNGGKLVSISRGRPLSSRKEISGDYPGNFYSVCPGTKGKLIVSYAENSDQPAGIYEFDLVAEKLGALIYQDAGFHSSEQVIAAPHEIPRDLPTELSEDKTTGLLMCMNADMSTIPVLRNEKTKSIQITGMDGLIMEIPVEKDGSFYVELTADAPVKLVSVGESGDILRGPCSWIYMRPNERRGCIGCHEDHELAPENVVVEAITKMPVEVVVPNTRHASEGSKGHTKIEE